MVGSPASSLTSGSAIESIPAGVGTALQGLVNVFYQTFVCNGVTPVNVVDPGVTSSSIIIPTLQTVGGTVGALPTVATITPGTGYTIKGTAADTSTYGLLRIG